MPKFPTDYLRTLSSMTKYPSIPTFHVLGDRGAMTSEVVLVNRGTRLIGREKLDGTNARIVFHAGMYLIGGREEFLYADGDLLFQKDNRIVETLRDTADRLTAETDLIRYMNGADKGVCVLYFEVFGTNVGSAHKEYAIPPTARLFDILTIDGSTTRNLLQSPLEKVSQWRESDLARSFFLPEDALEMHAKSYNLRQAPLLFDEVMTMPESIEDVAAFIEPFRRTRIEVSEEGLARNEGVVVRTALRSSIVKLRFEDYDKRFKKKLEGPAKMSKP